MRVRACQSQVMVVRDEPGVGKSALLEYLVESASGCRVARAAGIEYEMELAYAGLHQPVRTDAWSAGAAALPAA